MTHTPEPADASPPALSLEALADGVLGRDRAILARALTLIESGRPDHQALAQQLIQQLLPQAGNSIRLGVTGVPGVGKSTVVDQLGVNLIAAGHRVAVLAVDPTSKRTGGAILGDKTRMARLAQSPEAFIRPSPTSGTLGGVARRTRESIIIVEAAGFDVIVVETVGVGQSEIAVADMVDFFLVLLLAGGGDELQGIKRGVIEMADLIAVTKADGDNTARADRAVAELRAALNILVPHNALWTPAAMKISARDNQGIEELWHKVLEHRRIMETAGELEGRRRHQRVAWLRDMLSARLMDLLRTDPAVAEQMQDLERRVAAGTLTPTLAADDALRIIGLEQHRRSSSGPKAPPA